MDMTVALYARYLTDNQSVASIEDQFRIRRQRHSPAGCPDPVAGRQRGKFDIVLVEALDRV